MNRRQFLKAATITTLYTAASPFTALTQSPLPFPLLKITDKPALSVRAGLSSFGGMSRFVQPRQKELICPAMLIWLSRKSDYAFLPLPKATQGGVYGAKIALEADTIILAPTASSGMDVSETFFASHMLFWFIWKKRITNVNNFVHSVLSPSSLPSLNLLLLTDNATVRMTH